MAGMVEEPGSGVSTTVCNLKQALPASGIPLPSPFLRSLVRVLSVSNDGGRCFDNSPAFRGVKCEWAPIDFGTNSARCPRAMNILSGRLFSALSGASLDPPACPPDTPGCICAKTSVSNGASVSERVSNGGDQCEDIRILDISQFEIDSLGKGIEFGDTVDVGKPSGSIDENGVRECSNFEGRRADMSQVMSLDECTILRTETGNVNGNMSASIKKLETVLHRNSDEDFSGSCMKENFNGLPLPNVLDVFDRQFVEDMSRTGKSHTGDATEDLLPLGEGFEDDGGRGSGNLCRIKNPTGHENESQLTHVEGNKGLADMEVYDDPLLLDDASLFTGDERKHDNLMHSKLISLDSNLSSIGLEQLPTDILGKPLADSTTLVQSVDLEEGEISDDELQNSGESTRGFPEVNSCNKTTLEHSNPSTPIDFNIFHSRIGEKVQDSTMSPAFSVPNSTMHVNSGITKSDTDVASPVAEPLFKPEAEQVSDVCNKKRKRGPTTEHRKTKRKEKKKKKRAEENKRLGIKRLKLPISVPKPKPVAQCRFYMHGQCRQGKDCKFSHDAIPLTKSQPCKYYGSQSQPCLKGDACPYDHDLSKYPCHSFVLKGSCIRGDACLFSHKLPDNGDDSVALKQNCMEYIQRLSEKSNGKKLSTCSNEDAPTVSSNSLKIAGQGTTTVEKQKQQQSHKLLIFPSKAPEGLSFFTFENSALKDRKTPESLDSKSLKLGSASAVENLTMATKQSANLSDTQNMAETPSSSNGPISSLHPSSKLTEKGFKNVPAPATPGSRSQIVSDSKSSSADSMAKPHDDGSRSATAILEEFLFGFANK